MILGRRRSEPREPRYGGHATWLRRMDDALDERNARAFDVPDNSDEAPRLSERAAARYVTSGHAVQTVKAAKAGGAPREAVFSIVRLSQCVLLADSWGFQRCSRLLGAGVASPRTPASRLALPAAAAINVAAAGL